MAAYRRVHDSRHLQADCQESGSAPEPYVRIEYGRPFQCQLNRRPIAIQLRLYRPWGSSMSTLLLAHDTLPTSSREVTPAIAMWSPCPDDNAAAAAAVTADSVTERYCPAETCHRVAAVWHHAVRHAAGASPRRANACTG